MKRLSTRTKAELVAAFLVAYVLLLATAGDLERWAATPTLDARACPGSTMHIACRSPAAPARTRHQLRRRHSSASRVSSSAFVAVRGPSDEQGAGAARGPVAVSRPVSRATRVEVAALRHASKHVVAEVASLRPRPSVRRHQTARRSTRG